MKVLQHPHEIQSLVKKLKSEGKQIGFVPTMGALHEGHLSLVKQACHDCNIVIVSVFVNPLQFGPNEDLDQYPRTLEADKALLEKDNVDYLFCPMAAEMYPEGKTEAIELKNQAMLKVLCGAFRPGHFEGVLTVVAKLFSLVMPDKAYFGSKDYQQAILVQQMVHDLSFNVEIVMMPIIRDREGLALSSRNQYLSAGDRKRALALPETLQWVKGQIEAGQVCDLKELRQQAFMRLAAAVDKADYLEIIDPRSLAALSQIQPEMRAAAACIVGKTRLIDNVIITP